MPNEPSISKANYRIGRERLKRLARPVGRYPAVFFETIRRGPFGGFLYEDDVIRAHRKEGKLVYEDMKLTSMRNEFKEFLFCLRNGQFHPLRDVAKLPWYVSLLEDWEIRRGYPALSIQCERSWWTEHQGDPDFTFMKVFGRDPWPEESVIMRVAGDHKAWARAIIEARIALHMT